MTAYVVTLGCLLVATTTAGEENNGVASLMSTEKVMDSDEASTPSLWTEYNFCKWQTCRESNCYS